MILLNYLYINKNYEKDNYNFFLLVFAFISHVARFKEGFSNQKKIDQVMNF